MFQPQFFYEAGKARSGTALIPIKNASTFAFYVSTRVGDIIVDKGDGSALINHTVIYKNKDFTSNFPVNDDSILTGGTLSYSPAFTGNVSLKFPHGLKDVYSLANNKFGTNGSKLNITDVETFFKQFPNLYSFYFSEFGSTAIIKGDLSRFPNSVERLYFRFTQVVNASIDLFVNLSNYDPASKLKYFNVLRTDSPLKVLGDLGKTPSTLQFLNIAAVHAGSEITYTAGKIWASSFDTLYLPISLTVFENDNLLNDLKNSVTTAIGGKVIYLGGGYRSSASDSAVAYLTGLGFTISGVTRIAVSPQLILHTDANTYTSGTIWSDLSGNGNHITLVNNYAKDATYGGNIKFTNGSANASFPSIDSKYFTLLFWIKMDVLSNYNQMIMLGQSADMSNYWGGSFLHHSSSTGHIYAGTDGTTANRFELNSIYNNTTPKMVAFTFGNGTLKLYINGSLFATKTVINPTNPNFSKLLLGAGNLMNAKLGRVLLYNYPIVDSEISIEFNNNKTRFGL